MLRPNALVEAADRFGCGALATCATHSLALTIAMMSCGVKDYNALTISSVIFLASPNSIMVLSRKNN